MFEIYLAAEADTLNFGAQLAAICTAPCAIFLQGDLGAGKTTLVRGFLRGLGYDGVVKSPTYTLIEPYEINNQTIFHFDLYRLTKPEELHTIGFRDYLAIPSICIIEWPERALSELPAPDLTCYIHSSDSGRQLRLAAATAHGKQLLQQLRKNVKHA